MKHIISVSRRTDIPAFYSDWFFKCLDDGWAEYDLYGKTNHVSLLKDDVDAFVFWSKNYEPMLRNLDKLDAFGAPFYFHFTINAYNKDFEPNLPDLDDRIACFELLSKRYGKERVIWRYDPIFITMNGIDEKWHIDNFEKLCKRLNNFTNVCYISVIDIYNKVAKRKSFNELLDKDKIYNNGVLTENIVSLFEQMNKVSNTNNIKIKTCCEQQLAMYNGNCQGSCIDTKLLSTISKGKTSLLHKSAPTREGCGCAKVKDIGEFGTCKFGCTYCYAN